MERVDEAVELEPPADAAAAAGRAGADVAEGDEVLERGLEVVVGEEGGVGDLVAVVLLAVEGDRRLEPGAAEALLGGPDLHLRADLEWGVLRHVGGGLRIFG